ncbi:MAG: hypothetical protein D6710_06550, partial [Nitrospirae bacterium]
MWRSRWFRVYFVMSFFIIFALFLSPQKANSESRPIVDGPFSLTLKGGGNSDSGTIGLEARYDYISPLINLHLFGKYDWLDSGNGIGEIDNKSYGAGLALSHTYQRTANAYIGTSFLHELDKTFWHAYLGGKYKINSNIIVNGSYGIRFSGIKKISLSKDLNLEARAVNWLKIGAVYVADNGFKGKLYYYLNDPGDENISGIEGEISYPFTDAVTVGIRGSTDISTESNIDKNWKTLLFITYAFGEHRGKPIDIALDKNNPIEYPRIIRKTV